jgi:hypothetical protein
MKEWIITEFEKHKYLTKDDYITGRVSLYITGEESTENIENFIDLYEYEIDKVLMNEVQYDNFSHKEEIDYSINNKVIEIYIEYESIP